MKTLSSIFYLLFSVSAFAQLSVRNDNFIYASDKVLFVQESINLVESDSQIFLRNESQLIQGTETARNTGVGVLSVYQNSEVNHFAYHYWCSPVGGVLSDTNSNNSFRVNQIDDPLLSTSSLIDSNNSLFTNAYEGTISPSLTISRRWLWTYVVGDEYSDWNYVGDNLNIEPGLGFTMKGMGSGAGTSQFYDFRGKPNTGTITNSIADGEFTLIGNPYPSALDVADFLWDSDNVNLDEVDSPPALTTGAIYYWEQDPSNSNSHYLDTYVGGYASYTCTEPDGSDNIVESFVPATYIYYLPDGSPAATPPIGTGSRVASRYIPIGQGFMVEGAVGIPSGSSVYLKNRHRNFVKETSSNSFFFRNAEQNVSNSSSTQYNENFIIPDGYKRFRIIVSFNQLYSRELLANFHDNATSGFDYGLEAKRPSELDSDAYWLQDGEDFVIQANTFNSELRIPLIIDSAELQPLSFGIYDIQNFDEDQGIYLYDSEYDTYVNLRDQNYHLNVEPGNYTDRFEIVFTPSVLNIDDIEISDLIILQNNNNHELQIINPKEMDIKSIQVFDINGKLIMGNNYDTVLNHYYLDTVSLSAGIYIVNVSSQINLIKSQKIIVKN